MIQPFSITSSSIQLVTDTGESYTKLNQTSGVRTPKIVITPIGESQVTELATNTGDVTQNEARLLGEPIDLLSVDKVPTVTKASKGLAFAYFTTITNNSSSITAMSVTFLDKLPEEMIFTPNSVVVGNNYSYGSNPNDGISIGDIGPNQSLTVSFEVQVLTTIASSVTVLSNTASVQYSEEGTTQILTAEDTAILDLLDNRMAIFKTADKLISTVGDMIQYRVDLQNLTDEIQSISSFYDYIPAGTKYVKGTLTVNGKLNDDAIVEFPLGTAIAITSYDLEPSETTNLYFQVRVLSDAVKLGQVINNAGISYGPTGQNFATSGRTITEIPSIGRGVLFID